MLEIRGSLFLSLVIEPLTISTLLVSLTQRSISNESHTALDSTAVSIFVFILVELTNTVFVNSTNITTNIETAALSFKDL